jgi:hypothetical protein
MAEDSGAFKTNPAKSRPIVALCDRRKHRCRQASPADETFFFADCNERGGERCGIVWAT